MLDLRGLRSYVISKCEVLIDVRSLFVARKTLDTSANTRKLVNEESHIA